MRGATHSGGAHARHAAAVVAGFSLLYAGFFAPVWLRGGLLATGDALHYYLPNFVSPPPAWTPLLASGLPLRADPQAAFWSPWARLLGLLGSWNVFAISSYVLSSAFTYGLAWELTRSRQAAALAGLVLGLCGQLIAHFSHTAALHSIAWAPLLLWGLERLRRAPRGAAPLVIAVAVAGCAFGGHPQYLAYSLLVAGAFALHAARPHPERVRFLALAAGSMGVGVALAGVALLPLAEFARASVRAELSYADFFSHSLRPEQLPQLLFPYVYGGWTADPLGGAPLPYFARVSLNEVAGFVGLLPLVLVASVAGQARTQRRVRFWLVLASLCLLAALGKHVPVAAPLYLVPVLNKFRITARFLVFYSLAMAILSAFALAHLQRLDAHARRRAVVRAARAVALLALGLLALFLAILGSGHWEKYVTRAGLTAAAALPWRNPMLGLQLLTAGLGLAALLAWCRAPSPTRGALLALAVAFDLASFGGFYYWRAAPAADEALARPAALEALATELRESGQRLTPMGVDVPDDAAPPNRTRLWGVPSTLAYGPLVIGRYAELLGIDGAGFRDFAAFADAHRGLDLLASRYALVPRRWLDAEGGGRHGAGLRAALRGSRWRRREDLGHAALLENPRALPRVWLVGEALAADHEDVLVALRTGRLVAAAGRQERSFDPRLTALVEHPLRRPLACPPPCGAARILGRGDLALDVRSQASGSALLVTSDVAYPGWQVAIDGQPAPLLRVNSVLRGVRVPAGTHDVRFRFLPRSTWLGAGISVLAAGVWLGFATFLHDRRPRTRPGSS